MIIAVSICRRAISLALLSCLLTVVSPLTAQERADIVVLTETGDERNGLPVLAHHPRPEAVVSALHSGVSGVLIRVYRLVQQYRRVQDGTPVEPAYMLLSSSQGGYARYGFVLDGEARPGVAYVDLHRDRPLVGTFGSTDQLFPHELAHALRQQLAGPLQESGTNQVHAIGLRTDPVVAFNEGFAEHFQALALDHPDADPATAALAHDEEASRRADAQLRSYRRELTARLALATFYKTAFVVWYSNTEDVLRYGAVKDNLFARGAAIDDRLLTADPYRAYLLESVLPGDSSAPFKPAGRLLATEGAVAALFYHWANNEALASSYREPDFYRAFGVEAAQVSPLENLYLKIFFAFHQRRPRDTQAFVRGYRELFPDESATVDALVREIMPGLTLDAPAPPEIWLASPTFRTGTTLFDQSRAIPRVHTFDLNAASRVDLVTIPGVGAGLAARIESAAPFPGLEDLGRVPGLTAEVRNSIGEMATAMDRLRDEWAEESDSVLSIQAILMPYLWRLLTVILAGGVIAAVLYARVAGSKAWRAAVNGVAASVVGLGAGWLGGAAAGGASIAAVLLVFATPAALWQLWRKDGPRARRVALAWLAAAVPIAIAVTPF